MKNMIRILCMVALGSVVVVVNAGDADAGKGKVALCVACHGETGNSLVGSFPNLGGQGEAYLLKQLNDIKDGTREIPTMSGMLDGLSQEDLADIATFYSSQSRAYGAASADLVQLGESIYRFGIPRKNIAACTACHMPTGSGNDPAKFPALSGQWPGYTVQQLKAFQSGARHNDGDGEMMRTTTLDMNEQEMTAVASYIYGLK